MKPDFTHIEFNALFNMAHEAGCTAVASLPPAPTPVPSQIDPNAGFAWIRVRPAAAPFTKWLVGNRKAHAGLIWVGAYGTSYWHKIAYANAFARVLAQHGINATPGGGLDR